MSFWLIASCFTLLAIAFVALPTLWLRKDPGQNEPRAETLNVALLKENLDQLTLKAEAGLLTPEDYQLRKQELELRLVSDAAPQARPLEVSSGGNYKLLIVLVVLSLPLVTWILYQQLGSGQAWQLSQRYEALRAQLAQGEGDSDAMSAFVADLADFTDDGGSADWLFVQAQLYMQMGSYQAAADAYGKVVSQQPDSADLMARQAQAMYLAAGRKMTPEVDAMLDRVLVINPHQTTVLGIRGMDAFENANYALAIESWQKALAGMPPGSASIAVLEQGIRQAQAAMGLSGDSAPPLLAQVPGDAGFSDGIKVRVELDAAAEVKPGSTVFIIASSPQGGMPFAVVRMPVEELPTEVTLDDTTAMAPGNSLSRQSQVVVTARVSGSGNAIAQAGDWQGRSALLTPENLPPLVAVRIEQKI